MQLNKGIIVYEFIDKIMDSVQLRKNLFVSNSRYVLEYLFDKKTIPYKVIFGHSSWSRGQLETELKAGDWKINEVNNHFIFKNESIKMWRAAIDSISKNIGRRGDS